MLTPPLPPSLPPVLVNDASAESAPFAKVNSIYHKASKYTINAMAAGIGVSIAANLTGLTKGPAGGVISMIGGLIFITAFPAGILALCGLKKYGPRQLLWRGLVGVLVPILLISMAIPAFLVVRNSATTVFIKNIAAELNNGAPKMIDGITRLEKATVGPGSLLTVDYTITSFKVADVDRKAWDTEVRPVLKASILASPINRALRNDTKVVYRYFDSAGAKIDEIVLTEKDAPKK